MALMDFARWNLLRDVICRRKSGTLVIQLGKTYIFWVLREGTLLRVSSSHEDFTLTSFLRQQNFLNRDIVERASAGVSETRSLGSLLCRNGAADAESLKQWIARHAGWLCPYLLQSSAHLFWTDRVNACKSEFVHHDGISLSEILLACDRSFIETRSAFQMPEEMPKPYRLENVEMLGLLLEAPERRMLSYLKRGDGIDAMYMDPDLDRLTICRVLFLLWISGKLLPARIPAVSASETEPQPWMSRVRSIPPDWFIPLTVGILLGLLLSPPASRPSPASPVQQPRTRTFQSPAWSTDEKVTSTP